MSNNGVPPRNDSQADDYPVLYNEGSSELKYVKTGTKNTINTGGSSYLVYTAFLAQSGTDAPTATVKQNTLGGTVVWTRAGVGRYVGTLAGAFPVGSICNSIGSSANNNSVVMPVTDFSGIVGYIEYSPSGDTLNVNTYNESFVLTEMNTVIGGTAAQIVVDVKTYPA